MEDVEREQTGGGDGVGVFWGVLYESYWSLGVKISLLRYLLGCICYTKYRYASSLGLSFYLSSIYRNIKVLFIILFYPFLHFST